jgi:hypothetical protein
MYEVNQMRDLYGRIYENIRKIDFDAIWKGFHPYQFALYDKVSVYFKDKTISYEPCFIGNTSIKYDKEQIAIWCVEDVKDADPVMMASNMIHEMFHAYQFENDESRYPADLYALDYPDILENYILKHSESIVLSEAYRQKKKKDKLKCISQFIASRIEREKNIGSYMRCEYLAETLEGMAEYAGLCALLQLDKDLYEKRISEYIRIISDPGNTLFDTRRMAYFTGAILYTVLDEAKISVYHEIKGAIKTPFEILKEKIPPTDLPVTVSADDVKASYKGFLLERSKKFDDFFSKKRKSHEGDFQICGYDPMNMIKENGRILCKYFIMLKQKTEGDPLFINGPVVVDIKKGTSDKVSAYYT